MKLSYLTKKRIKLITTIIIIPLTIFIIAYFVHDLMLVPYTKSQMKVLTEWFKTGVYNAIRDEAKTESERKILWNLAESDAINKISTDELLQYYRVFYIIVAIMIVIIALILSKWYNNDAKDIFISDKPKEGTMNYKIISDLEKVKEHFRLSDSHIIFTMPNGIKICSDYKEAEEYYKNRCKEAKKG